MRAPRAKDALFYFATIGFNFAIRKNNLTTSDIPQSCINTFRLFSIWHKRVQTDFNLA